MLIGAIADDFTGASDLANTLARGGMRTVQYVGVPAGAQDSGAEAGVVALKSRTIPAAQAAQSLAACDWLIARGCRQIIFKYCSTFDSTPEGNIGPVAEALIEKLGADIAVVCPAFPTNKRTIYMGHLFVGDRLLSESGMEKHPLTPMTDPDLVRFLRRQTKGEVGLVPLSKVSAGAGAVTAALATMAGNGIRLAVADAVSDADLMVLGAALDGAKLVTGGSGIALGLPANFRKAGLLTGGGDTFVGLDGPGVALSGSCSSMSRQQVVAYVAKHPGLLLEADAILSGRQTVDAAFAHVMERIALKPMVYSTANPDEVAAAQARHGRETVAAAIEDFFGELTVRFVNAGVRRIVVGGGETSGAVVQALERTALLIGPEIDPGVPALIADGDPPVALALKSGNFGAVDFYEKAFEVMAGKTRVVA
jgi:3-dehydrotetronate 4-kinase